MAKAKDPVKPEGDKEKDLELTREGMRKAAGSGFLDVQIELLEQAMAALWKPDWKTDNQKTRAMRAAYETLKKIAPRSELEGMLAIQMIATHNAAMECLRRAMIDGQGMESRDQNLKHATKLMSLYERQLTALDKHRGKGQQKITVEHVNVHAGGQAIVGNVTTGEAAPALSASTAKQPAALVDETNRGPDGEELKKALKKKAPEVRAKTRK